MNKQSLICINCPNGCHLTATPTSNGFTVIGNLCPLGKSYAQKELTNPTRIITCLIKVSNCDQPLSVKTTEGVPKEMVFQCIKAIKSTKLNAPIKIGQIVLSDLLGTGIDVIATKSISVCY